MDEKSIMIQGMSQIIAEQRRHQSDMRRTQGALETMDHIQNLGKNGSAEELKRALEREKDESRKVRAALQEKEALLKEWMHSNEAFKRLARKYGKKLGLSDEQRVNDYDDVVLEVAEEKPEFADTNTLKEVKEARGIK